MYNIPIVLSIHTRPETLKAQLCILKKINPKKIYTIIDPPLQREDNLKKTIYFNRSLDLLKKCNLNIIPLITNNYNQGHFLTFFEGVKKLILLGECFLTLENDSLPSDSYFLFVENILKQFKSDNKFLCVSGCTYFKYKKENNKFFFKSKFPYPLIAPASTPFHLEDSFFNIDKNINYILNNKNKFNLFLQQRIDYLTTNFLNKNYNRVDLDTYLLLYSMLKNKFSIFPYNNMVENCGFDTQSRNLNFNRHLDNNLIYLKSFDCLPTIESRKIFFKDQQIILKNYLSLK